MPDATDKGEIVFKKDTACTRLECCRHLHKLCLHNPCPVGKFPFFGQAGRRSMPPGWLRTLQRRGMSSQILARRHKQTHSSHGFVTSVINKQHNLIRCNDTHWVHLKYTQIKRRQYKANWRFTIHTPTQIVTTTPSTDNTTTHHQQITTHSQSTKGQNLVILQININGIRNKIEELKKTRTQHPTGHHHNARNKTHTLLQQCFKFSVNDTDCYQANHTIYNYSNLDEQ